MDTVLDLIKPTNEDLIKNNITEEQWEEFTTYIKERTQIYKEENAHLESVFTKLQLLTNEVKLLSDISNDVSRIEESLCKLVNLTHSTTPPTVLTKSERMRKHRNYVSKLKACIRVYVNLNESLSKEVRYIKWDSDRTRDKLATILNLTGEEVQQLEEKAKKYENELLKFEKKYPWLKDPQFDLPNISREAEMLQNLKQTKEQLVKDLDVYLELKPDIREAIQQLADLKEEHKQLTTKIQITKY